MLVPEYLQNQKKYTRLGKDMAGKNTLVSWENRYSKKDRQCGKYTSSKFDYELVTVDETLQTVADFAQMLGINNKDIRDEDQLCWIGYDL